MSRKSLKTRHLLHEISEFLSVMSPGVKAPGETVQWHFDRLSLVIDRDPARQNILSGLVLFRKINEPDQAEDRWFQDLQGKMLWVDEAVSLRKGGLAEMITRGFVATGRTFSLVGFRKRKNPYLPVRVYPVAMFDRMIRAGV